MSITHPDWMVLGAVVLTALVGRFWLSKTRWGAPAKQAEEPTLRLPRRAPANDLHDEEEAAPESGIRLRSGAYVRKIDSRRL